MKEINFAFGKNDFCFALLMVTVFIVTVAIAVAGYADLGRSGDVQLTKSGQLRVAMRNTDAAQPQAARAGPRK